MAKTRLSVLVGDQHLARLPDVVRRLREAGLEVDQVLDAAGTVTGSIESSQMPALSQVDGVAAVEASHDYQLPPPDADIQ